MNIIKLPGLIDTHVHLREPGGMQKEDFETGTKAAIAGGYTIVLDMPNNVTPTITPEALEKKIKLAQGRIYSDVGFHFGGTGESAQYFLDIADKVFALKVYMNHTTGTLLVEEDADLHKVFSSWPKDKVIMTHCEGQTLIEAIDLAQYYKLKLHVCHISLKQELEAIITAKEEGMQITCEVDAHHLFLTQEDEKRLGAYGKMRPPLSAKEDQEFLWGKIDWIDTIASDHAPHSKEEKDSENPPNGVPGLETTLPLMLTAVADGKTSMERLTQMTSTNPRKIFGIPEQEETYVEVDLDMRYAIGDRPLFTKSGWSPFEGMDVKGKVIKVVLRGETIFENGQFLNGPRGQIIYPA